MRRFFYQANFCAECGLALPQRRVPWPRYFCDVCGPQRRQRSLLFRALLPLGLLSGALSLVFAWHNPAEQKRATVSAFDTITRPQPAPTPAPIITQSFCGARTKRGTPCRRLVQTGQRCSQHR